MKNVLKSSLALLVASAVLGVGAPDANAVPINGSITFNGGAVYDSNDIAAATRIVAWRDGNVASVDGDFAAFVSAGDSVVRNEPFAFGSGIDDLWAVGGFSFDLLTSTIDFQNATFLAISGFGIVSGNGFTPTEAVWRFTSQEPDAAGIFSFSSSTDTVNAVPDGGATVALFGLSLLGLQAVRRIFGRKS